MQTTNNTILQAEKLCKKYHNRFVVNNLSLSVNKGEIVGILGPNGAGKTTTLEMIEGIRKPDSGKISLLGLDPTKELKKLSHKIGIQFQSTSLQPRLTVSEALNLFSSLYKEKRDINELIGKLDLKPYLEASIQNLSGGCKQRLMIALAVIHNPEVIFLDEPSSGLDPKAQKDIWNFILQLKSEQKTILMTTHYMEEARRLCDRIAFVYEGKILDIDTPAQLAAKHSSESYISFESLEASTDLLNILEGIGNISQEGSRFKIYSNSLQSTALELFVLAQEQRWRITDFCFSSGTLEDLFIKLAKATSEEDHEYAQTGTQ